MNIIKTLKKEIEKGKDIMLNDGNIISKDAIRQTMLKGYLAGVKAGEIPTDKSFDVYMNENAGDYVSVQEVIDFIEGAEAEDEE